MKKKKLTFQNLIYDNRIVLVFSLIAALIIWLVVAIQFSPEDDRVVEGVPVKIEVSNNVMNLGLEMFGKTDYKVDVKVHGKRYEVAESVLSPEDIVVTAKTNYVDSAGSHVLKLEVNAKNPESMDYDIVSVSRSSITVYFDYYKEGEYALEPDIEIPDNKDLVPDGYVTDTPLLSENVVHLSGPATEMDKIKKVVARAKVEDILKSTTTFETEIVPLSEYGARLQYITANDGTPDITMTVPVYKIAKMPTTVTFRNVPEAYKHKSPNFTCEPKELEFAMEEKALADIKALSIADVDFYMLDEGMNTIKVDLTKLPGVKVLGDQKEATIKINIKDSQTKWLGIPKENISFKNVPKGYRAVIEQNGINSVKIIGPQYDIKNINPNNVMAEVDLSRANVNVPNPKALARGYIKGNPNCWVYDRYNVSYRLEKIN